MNDSTWWRAYCPNLFLHSHKTRSKSCCPPSSVQHCLSRLPNATSPRAGQHGSRGINTDVLVLLGVQRFPEFIFNSASFNLLSTLDILHPLQALVRPRTNSRIRKRTIHQKYQQKNKAFWSIVTITALISIVFLGSYWTSGHVFRHTEAWEGHVSFGINATYYSPQFAEPGLFKQVFRTWKLALVSIAAFFTWRSLQAKSPRLQPNKASITHTSLTVGYLIYTCVYFLSKSWDYRLIYMIFCLPYFFSNGCIAGRSTRVWAIVAMTFTLYELYIPVTFLGGALESLSDLIAQPVLIGLLGACVFHKQNQ